MTPRVQWSDIAQAARETSEAINGKDWVNAGIKARVLLADLADEVDRLKATIEAQGLELADFREIDPVPDEGDGTHRLCMALYGEVKARKYIGGSNARMLHDAAAEIGRLRTVNKTMANRPPTISEGVS